MLTTALTVTTETTNPATRVMDSSNVAMVFYTTTLVHPIWETNLSCGTTLEEYVITNPLPVIQHIYEIEEKFQFV